jgi:hypothetical protein
MKEGKHLFAVPAMRGELIEEAFREGVVYVRGAVELTVAIGKQVQDTSAILATFSPMKISTWAPGRAAAKQSTNQPPAAKVVLGLCGRCVSREQPWNAA